MTGLEIAKEFAERLSVRSSLEIIETLNLTCPVHGPYRTNRIRRTYPDGSKVDVPPGGCPQCREEAYRREIADQMQAIQIKAKTVDAQIPEKFKNCLVRNFEIRDPDPVAFAAKAKAQNIAVAFIKDDIRNAVLLGGTDRGKSHLLAAMLKGSLQRGKSALYVIERKIYRDIHESYLGRKDLPTEGQVIDKYVKIDVLGIDEIGRSSWTEHEAQILYEIIDRRDCENRKTVMAGNLLPDEFKAKFDDSFRRKLGAVEVVCSWGQYSKGAER